VNIYAQGSVLESVMEGARRSGVPCSLSQNLHFAQCEVGIGGVLNDVLLEKSVSRLPRIFDYAPGNLFVSPRFHAFSGGLPYEFVMLINIETKSATVEADC
jgi:hypothetical protein